MGKIFVKWVVLEFLRNKTFHRGGYLIMSSYGLVVPVLPTDLSNLAPFIVFDVRKGKI
jgi:hypothetical protein